MKGKEERATLPGRRPTPLLLLLFGLGAGALVAQPPAGAYRGITAQGLDVEIVLDEAGQVLSWEIDFDCEGSLGTTLVATSCDAALGSFSCGAAVCAPFSTSSSIAGAFDGSQSTINGSFTLADQPGDSSCCDALIDVAFVAEWESLAFADGFEATSTGRWSAIVTSDPLLEFAVWAWDWSTGGGDTLRAVVDGITVFELGELPQLDLATDYLLVHVPLVALGAGQNEVEFVGSSAADDAGSSYFLDDVAIVCPQVIANPIDDGGFEDGAPNAAWTESSTNFGTPLCNFPTCGQIGARTGNWWAWFGGIDDLLEEGSVGQRLSIPDCP